MDVAIKRFQKINEHMFIKEHYFFLNL